jgi:hypothetical protein
VPRQEHDPVHPAIWPRPLGVLRSIAWLCLPHAIRGLPVLGETMFPQFEKSIAVVMAYVVLASAFIVGAELLVVILL